MFFVNAGRSQYFAVAVALGMMYMVHRRSSVKQIGAVLLLCVGTYIALNSSVIASIMEGISADVVDGTISYRVEYLEKLLHAYGYSIMGMGYVGPSVPFGMHSFNFIDYGLLGDVLQFGIVSLYFYTMILCRGISAIRSSKDEYSRLFLTGFVWFFIASIVGFTVISGKRIIFVPVILAYMEYAYRCAKEGILPDAKEGLPIVKFVIRY